MAFSTRCWSPAEGGPNSLPLPPLRRRRLLVLLPALLAAPAVAQLVLERAVDVARIDDDTLQLGYGARLELPRAVADALHRGVALHFVAEARVRRNRWYWRDVTLAEGVRSWRLSHQPLTRQYRLAAVDGLSQSFDRLEDALSLIARATRWQLALREAPRSGETYALDFSLKLDLSQLPGPLQIGLGPGASLGVSETRRLSLAELGL